MDGLVKNLQMVQEMFIFVSCFWKTKKNPKKKNVKNKSNIIPNYFVRCWKYWRNISSWFKKYSSAAWCVYGNIVLFFCVFWFCSTIFVCFLVLFHNFPQNFFFVYSKLRPDCACASAATCVRGFKWQWSQVAVSLRQQFSGKTVTINVYGVSVNPGANNRLGGATITFPTYVAPTVSQCFCFVLLSKISTNSVFFSNPTIKLNLKNTAKSYS